MVEKINLQGVVKRILSSGALGVSVGLSSIAPGSASVDRASLDRNAEASTGQSFAARLDTVRKAVSQHLELQDRMAQVIPHPFANVRPFQNVKPFENVKPFLNNFGKHGTAASEKENKPK